jgi:branched-chain amino acid transport system ATP-binding protein
MGKSIKGQGAWDLVKQGLVMVPEGRGTFTRMTITENLQMGAFVRNDNEIDADIDKVFAIFPRLKERGAAGRHDERRRAADAGHGPRADGPAQGAAAGRAQHGPEPIMVDKIFEVVADIHSRGTTVLLVEQNASRALSLANRGYVMDSGEITMSGEAKAAAGRPQGARGLPGRTRGPRWPLQPRKSPLCRARPGAC